MKKTSRTKLPASAESIARLADNGQDISSYFTNKGKMMPPLGSVGIDLNDEMIEELDEAARRLNVSRQALIKRFIRSGLEQHSLAQKARKAG
ncbi:MAG: CopG family transcriptional regulator [Pyrinomonadaceae bacterium]